MVKCPVLCLTSVPPDISFAPVNISAAVFPRMPLVFHHFALSISPTRVTRSRSFNRCSGERVPELSAGSDIFLISDIVTR